MRLKRDYIVGSLIVSNITELGLWTIRKYTFFKHCCRNFLVQRLATLCQTVILFGLQGGGRRETDGDVTSLHWLNWLWLSFYRYSAVCSRVLPCRCGPLYTSDKQTHYVQYQKFRHLPSPIFGSRRRRYVILKTWFRNCHFCIFRIRCCTCGLHSRARFINWILQCFEFICDSENYHKSTWIVFFPLSFYLLFCGVGIRYLTYVPIRA